MNKIIFVIVTCFLSLSNFGQHEPTTETAPEFKGGMQELYTFVGNNLKYPEEAMMENIQGYVSVNFTIDTNGKVQNVNIPKGVSPSLDKETIRIFSLMPDWTPGTINGKKVAVEYSTALYFSISDGNANVHGTNREKGSYMTQSSKQEKALKYIKMEDYKSAKKYLKLAYKGNPLDTDTIFNLALVYSKLGKSKNACKFWKKGAKLGDNEAETQLEIHCAQ